LDYGQLAQKLGAQPVVCGNLPYHLSSRILVSLADQARSIRSAVLMVQREVADRLAANPGGRTFGLLSVLVQRALMVSVLRRVSPAAFHPRPKVTSAVVRLEPRATLVDRVTDRRLVSAARAAFSTRRKTLKNSLRRGLAADGRVVVGAIVAAQIDPSARAERLSVDDFARLGNSLAAAGLLE
jgi:16S rRNA (adenine1518-N6/adenine1519-N6)-dimethyltransferase